MSENKESLRLSRELYRSERDAHLEMLDRSCAAIGVFGYSADDYSGTDDLPACIDKLGKERDKLRETVGELVEAANKVSRAFERDVYTGNAVEKMGYSPIAELRIIAAKATSQNKRTTGEV